MSWDVFGTFLGCSGMFWDVRGMYLGCFWHQLSAAISTRYGDVGCLGCFLEILRGRESKKKHKVKGGALRERPLPAGGRHRYLVFFFIRARICDFPKPSQTSQNPGNPLFYWLRRSPETSHRNPTASHGIPKTSQNVPGTDLDVCCWWSVVDTGNTQRVV